MTDPAEQILDLIRQGHAIAASKLLREQTGMNLTDAKAVVERVRAGQPLPPLPGSAAAGTPPAVELSDAVRELAGRGETIAAIKQLRAETGLGLKDAKDLVDQVPLQTGARRSGCLTGVLLLAAVAGALALWA